MRSAGAWMVMAWVESSLAAGMSSSPGNGWVIGRWRPSADASVG
jgi:hypothetical protein